VTAVLDEDTACEPGCCWLTAAQRWLQSGWPTPRSYKSLGGRTRWTFSSEYSCQRVDIRPVSTWTSTLQCRIIRHASISRHASVNSPTFTVVDVLRWPLCSFIVRRRLLMLQDVTSRSPCPPATASLERKWWTGGLTALTRGTSLTWWRHHRRSGQYTRHRQELQVYAYVTNTDFRIRKH